MKDSSKAPKRTKMQIDADRRRLSELMLQGYTHGQMRDILYEETGTHLSRRTVGIDIKKIRDSWMKAQERNIEMWMNQELARIDSTEAEAWKSWRASMRPSERRVVEETAADLDEDDPHDRDLIVSRIQTTTENDEGVGDPRFFNIIVELQKERRKLLGVYAPSKLGIDIMKKSQIEIKGYGAVSPDDWPDIVEGEVVNEVLPELTDGAS